MNLGPSLLADIAVGLRQLDPAHGERGVGDSRRGSALAALRSPADLDVVDLTDPRNPASVHAVLRRWADRVTVQRPGSPFAGEAAARAPIDTLQRYWSWAVAQPWGPAMVAELEALRERVHQRRVRLCPVCARPVLLDRLVIDHRDCINSVPGPVAHSAD